MQRGLLAAGLLLLTPILAGCAEESADTAAANGQDPVVFTSPEQMAEAASSGSAPHLHDYWQGAESLVVMDGSYRGGALVITDYATFDMQPEPGDVVPQGASSVDVTLSWADDAANQYTNPELWVRTAEDNEPWLVGPIVRGEPLTVESTNSRNDLPHQVLSAWIFQLRLYPVEPTTQAIAFSAAIEIQAVARLGLEIPLYPAHPDRWDNATEIDLGTVEIPTAFIFENEATGQWCLNACLEPITPRDGAIVPSDAALVEITITMGQDAAATRLGLSFHGADVRDFQRISPDETDGATRVYRIPLGAGMGDGPYAKQSLWEFRLFVEAPAEDALHVGSLTLSGRVLKHG